MKLITDKSLERHVQLYLAMKVFQINTLDYIAASELHMKASLLRGVPALIFSNGTGTRICWAVWSESNSSYLIWFDEGQGMEVAEQHNYVPLTHECRSIYCMQEHEVAKIVFDFIGRLIMPANTMPPGHLDSLSG